MAVHGGRARRTRRRHRAAGQRIHTAELAVGHAAADPVPGVPHGGYALASLGPKVSQKRCIPLPCSPSSEVRFRWSHACQLRNPGLPLPKPGSTVSVFCHRDFAVVGVWIGPRRRVEGHQPTRSPLPGRWIGHRWTRRPSSMQAAAGPEGWMRRRSWRWQVRWGTARSAAGPAPAGTVAPRASGWAGAGASVGRSGSAGRAGSGSGSVGSWW
jgi:hypothetical protein